jgi:hypothetical protein
MWLALVTPRASSEVIVLQLRDPLKGKDSYLWAYIFIGVMYIAAAACLWVVRIWKVDDNEPQIQPKDNRPEPSDGLGLEAYCRGNKKGGLYGPASPEIPRREI